MLLLFRGGLNKKNINCAWYCLADRGASNKNIIKYPSKYYKA